MNLVTNMNNTTKLNYNDLSQKEAIQILEKVNNIQFSKEQLDILNAPAHHPLVVNACAGAGKTTIFIYKAILNMITGRSDGRDTFGITFSKDAQVEMKKRFYNLRNKLIQAGTKSPALMNCDPRFKTFHALFFQLLRSYNHNLRVIINPTSNPRFTFTFYNILARSHYDMDDKEILNDIFKLRDELINRGWSIDGLTIFNHENDIDPIKTVVSNLNVPNHTDTFFNDYAKIIKTYQNMKRQANLVDFTDMQTILYQQINQDEYARSFYTQQLKQYKYVFLDEFQDIDNLQWKLMTSLLSNDTKKNLFVIGDDDQAIYGFRGGSAKYIIDFKEFFSDAHQFHLSTNYRTGGKILKSAKPMIKNNLVRINKDLQAYYTNKGKIYINRCNHRTTNQNDTIFERLIKVTQDNNISPDSIAVLVRHNTTRSMVADFLANHGIYANISHTNFILQNNKIYRTFTELIYALLYNNFDAFYHHAKEIGFSKYRNHVKELIEENGFQLNQIDKLSDYLALAHKSKHQSKLKNVDKKVEEFYKKAQLMVSKNTHQTKQILNILIKSVHKLVDSYYGYMTKKQFISTNDYQMATTSLKDNLLHNKYQTPQDFFEYEKEKADYLENVTINKQNRDLDIITLHQAKGLQYPHVFLIGLDNTDINNEDVELANMFPSNTTFKQFLSILHDNLPSKNKRNTSRQEDICKEIWNTSKDQHEKHIPNKVFECIYDIQVRHLLPPHENNDVFHFIDKNRYVENHQHPVKKVKKTVADDGHIIPTIIKYVDMETGDTLPVHKKYTNARINQYDQDIKDIYRYYIYNAKFVESERKLLYVGITRSQSYMYLDIPTNPNPLLRELNLKQSIQENNIKQN